MTPTTDCRIELEVKLWDGFTLACECDYSTGDRSVGWGDSIEVLSAIACDMQGNRGGDILEILNAEQIKRITAECERVLSKMKVEDYL